MYILRFRVSFYSQSSYFCTYNPSKCTFNKTIYIYKIRCYDEYICYM